jgi:hypothetical protein
MSASKAALPGGIALLGARRATTPREAADRVGKQVVDYSGAAVWPRRTLAPETWTQSHSLRHERAEMRAQDATYGIGVEAQANSVVALGEETLTVANPPRALAARVDRPGAVGDA